MRDCVRVFQMARLNSSLDRTRRAFASVFRGVECVVDEEGLANYMRSAQEQGSVRNNRNQCYSSSSRS